MPTRTEIMEIEEIRDPYPSDFASRLRAFRKERKIKQTEFAEKLGIDIQKCRRYEKTNSEQEASPAEHTAIKKSPKKGKSPEPDVETLKNMASILNITVDELIGYKPATINIATGILTKAGIAFKKDKEGDAYVLYRYKTKEESDAYYLDPYSNDMVPFDDQDPGLLEVYARDEWCSFIEIPNKFGFRIYNGKELFFPEVPEKGKGLQVYSRLTEQGVLDAVATEEIKNTKVFYNSDFNGAYEPKDIKDILSNIKMIKLSAAKLKTCVFEAKRKTDSIIKTALNTAYAAFYPTIFWNYINDEKYSTWSVVQIDRLPEKFSERLRVLRGNKYSQTEMSNKVGLSLQTYNRYETQDAQPSIDMLKKLALELGISVDILIGFKMDYVNEALNFLKKVNITCTRDNETDLYYVQVPDREPQKITGTFLQFCAYQAKEDVDKLIAANLHNIFNETFTPLFWELADHPENNMPENIIDENDYEPYLYELDLMNKPQ